MGGVKECFNDYNYFYAGTRASNPGGIKTFIHGDFECLKDDEVDPCTFFFFFFWLSSEKASIKTSRAIDFLFGFYGLWTWSGYMYGCHGVSGGIPMSFEECHRR